VLQPQSFTVHNHPISEETPLHKPASSRKHGEGSRFLCCLQTGKGAQHCCADRASLPRLIARGTRKHFCNKRLMQDINIPWESNEDIEAGYSVQFQPNKISSRWSEETREVRFAKEKNRNMWKKQGTKQPNRRSCSWILSEVQAPGLKVVKWPWNSPRSVRCSHTTGDSNQSLDSLLTFAWHISYCTNTTGLHSLRLFANHLKTSFLLKILMSSVPLLLSRVQSASWAY